MFNNSFGYGNANETTGGSNTTAGFSTSSAGTRAEQPRESLHDVVHEAARPAFPMDLGGLLGNQSGRDHRKRTNFMGDDVLRMGRVDDDHADAVKRELGL